MSKKTVTSRLGKVFEVDISNEACEKFGFKHGDRIIAKTPGEKATVIGVAPPSGGESEKTLWYALDGDNGRVSYSEPWEGRLEAIED